MAPYSKRARSTVLPTMYIALVSGFSTAMANECKNHLFENQDSLSKSPIVHAQIGQLKNAILHKPWLSSTFIPDTLVKSGMILTAEEIEINESRECREICDYHKVKCPSIESQTFGKEVFEAEEKCCNKMNSRKDCFCACTIKCQNYDQRVHHYLRLGYPFVFWTPQTMLTHGYKTEVRKLEKRMEELFDCDSEGKFYYSVKREECDVKSNICLVAIDPMCLHKKEWINTCVEDQATIESQGLHH